MNSITTVLLIIFAFTFVPLVIAEFSRKEALPTIEDFFLQSRKMSSFISFFTVYATWVSSFAFMGSSGYFYANGPVYLTAFAWNALFGILFLVIGKRLWFYGKANGYVTPTDFFNDIFESDALNLVVTSIMIVFTIPYLQIQLSGGAYLIEIATQGMIPWRISGLVFYLVIIIYLWAGGLRAVAWADVFYGILIFTGMLFCGFYLAEQAGGVESLFRQVSSTYKNHFVLGDAFGNSGTLLWIAMFITVPIGALMGPQLWLRMYAVDKKKTFTIMPFLLCFSAIQYLGAILSGTAGLILLPGLIKSDTIIPLMLAKFAPPVLGAFLFCCIASAALSTANSQIHAIAAIYAIDIHKRYINKSISERKVVSIGKWAILLFSGLAYLLLLQSPALIIETGVIALSGTAQIIIPTLGALFWNRSNPNAAIAGLLTGIAVIVVATFMIGLNSSFGCIAGLAANAIIFIVLSILEPNNNRTRSKIANYKIIYDKNQ